MAFGMCAESCPRMDLGSLVFGFVDADVISPDGVNLFNGLSFVCRG